MKRVNLAIHKDGGIFVAVPKDSRRVVYWSDWIWVVDIDRKMDEWLLKASHSPEFVK